jgi:two-component system, OmpR family, osmolarity sensor histidine kinase EnvZ
MRPMRQLLRSLLPRSLFARALLTLVGTFGLFALATLFLVVHYLLYPLGDRSAADLAGIMVLSARTLVQLPPDLRDDYRARLAQEYDLRLAETPPEPDPSRYFFPFVDRLELALEQRLGRPVQAVAASVGGDRWFWVPLDVGDRTVWTGFPQERLRTRPLEGMAALGVLALLLVIGSATLLARRISRPLQQLSAAAAEVALGRSPKPLPETGPAELASLAAQFNEMSRQVRELLAARTVLLAGVSHDLRTPLTRLRLAIAMLPPETPAESVSRMERDIDEMSALIAQAVDFARNLGGGSPENLDLSRIVGDLVADRPRVVWVPQPPCPCRVDGLALRRILDNLLENALRYSSEPVEVRLDCQGPRAEVYVLDRGPGIPESEREAVFRPYYRLERSRSRLTGGSGLGLAVASQLAQANGIELHLGARRGGGTVVRVRLPAVAPEAGAVDGRGGPA